MIKYPPRGKARSLLFSAADTEGALWASAAIAVALDALMHLLAGGAFMGDMA
jgi:hypothetical protein